LNDLAPTDPVPVRLSLANWDTSQPLQAWLAEQISERFSERGISMTDARALIEHNRVLPVLDGLDEMDATGTPVARRRAARAVERLNAYQNALGSAPLVLTCRTAQYGELAAADVRMREAARIEIEPVDNVRAIAYLNVRITNPDRWRPVLATLVSNHGGPLARSLDTPWRLNLAATVYEERDPGTLAYLRDPADLCALASPRAVRDHLLERYLPAAVSQHPARPNRYTARQTQKWLAQLATHLARTTPAAGTDLVLHQLWPMAGPKRVRTADTLPVALLILTYLYLLARYIRTSGSTLHELAGAMPPVLVGILALWRARSASVPPPRTGQLHRLRSPGRDLQLGQTTVFGLAIGVATGLMGGLTGGLVFGLTWGLAGGLTAAVTLGLTGPAADTAPRSGFTPPTDPRHPIRDDLLFGLTFVLVFAVTAVLIVEFTGPTGGPTSRLGVGLAGGLTGGASLGMYLLGGAGRRYVSFLCCSRGRLPWRLGAFLHWAYGAGLLRVSGMAYQFRHRELQDWLVSHSPAVTTHGPVEDRRGP
ncbi:NACHT domain-containing protein, partial [Streptomyces sp.]|uniref:NACHT domain-containing protein n=1 Tax=Streptomyces sp. TaxID=1931 RepID=UPI002F3E2D96